MKSALTRIPSFLITALVLSLPLSIASFAQMDMAKPPELKKLEYFSGNWTCDGDVKPGPMGPGGKMTMSEDAKWMDGGFFVVTQSQFKSATMNGSGTSFLGYDSSMKKYTYNEFNSMGEATQSFGTVDGDNWTWIGDMKPAGKGRFTEKILSPTSYAFAFAMTSDGGNWTPVMDGKCTKK